MSDTSVARQAAELALRTRRLDLHERMLALKEREIALQERLLEMRLAESEREERAHREMHEAASTLSELMNGGVDLAATNIRKRGRA